MVTISRGFAEEAERRGVDLEGALPSRALVDPVEVAGARIDFAEEMLREAEEYVAKGNVVQASEKIYKAVEECVKALAERFNVKQLEEVRRRGRWDAWLLGQASTDLSRILGEDRIRFAWATAYDVHVWGFHEAKYRLEDVESALPIARWLLEYARKVVQQAK
ncbi:PaREP1 family protein [Thermofilum pendens]|uniref:PaREP8 domain containing protein n=1 Tax=Thermofilum pendens (strain DSM 2475 / Hrk 5) TaxID=368408 RepID=A1S0W1_THEPD|nr:PaREP1 family protein [Thermofilum pendens]ABL79091.1 PaREP8 domain containing protein [Thermofilum pendens Hrk 5]